jgi:hypothetical protein
MDPSILNENPKVTSLKLLTYSRLLNNIDQQKEKNEKSKYTFLNLKKLVENFILDIELDAQGIPGYTKSPSLPAFISKSYYQSSPEYAFNDPPKGPIPLYFECIHCDQEGPNFHLKNCIKPFESSLYLAESGEDHYKKTAGTSYKLIVKKRGQKKVISTSVKNQRFSDNVELMYENENKTHTTIKIGKNGVINIISANFENKSIESDLFKKINQTGALNESEYNDYTFKIDKSTSYTYIILAQFNLYPKDQKNLFINLEALNLNLWETPLFKQKKGSQTFFVLSPKRYQVQNYRYNSGNIISKSNKQTNPFIQFDLINGIFKIGILIYKKGAVQMRLSYLDKNFNEKVDYPLETSTLQEVYTFLKKLFEILIQDSSETNYPIIVSEIIPEKKGILNMVDGGQPKMCQNRKGAEIRPVPYSFYGKCPINDYYVRPMGVKRPDGKFEPCCYKIKNSGKDSKKAINERFVNGFNEGIPDPDTLSAVYIPGTKTIESRSFKGLNNLTQEQLLDFMEEYGYIGKKNPFSKTKSKETFKDIFERFSYYTGQNKNSLMVGIPNETIRSVLSFSENLFINTSEQSSETGLPKIPSLAGTIMDGYLDIEENIYYPFDIIYFKGQDISKNVYKKRFDTLMYCIEVLNNSPGSLTISTNFDDSLENIISEEDIFILFIPLNSVYTQGKINKDVKIWTSFMEEFISLNVHEYRGNRWKVDIQGKEISQILLPQKNDSIEIPIVFTNKNAVSSGDIILFKINMNMNGIINHNKPLIPIEKVSEHINDYIDIINILEFIKNPIKKENLI